MLWKNPGHELDCLGENFANKKNIIFFGVTDTMIEVYKRVSFLEGNIIYCDSRISGEKIGDTYVKTFEEGLSHFDAGNSILIITIEDNVNSVYLKKYLLLNKYKENIDFFTADIFMNMYLPIYLLYAHNICYIEFLGHPSSFSCTLRCKYCSASMPYLKVKNPSIQRMKDEIDMLFSKVDFLYTYDCTAGETFLVSDKLVEILEYLILNYYGRFGEILFTTNATVIPTEKMLSFLKKYKDIVRINVSIYENVDGWKEKYLNFRKVLEENNILYQTIHFNAWIDMGFSNTTLDKTDEEMQIYFRKCNNFCRTYYEGKEYYCSAGFCANLAFYDTKQNDEEAIDFSDDNINANIIVEYNLGYQKKGYLGVCRHCNNWGTQNNKYISVAEQIK